MKRVAFNLNQYLYVRLTEQGLQHLRDQHNALAQTLPVPAGFPAYIEPQRDERGFYAMQAWEFMQAFGAASGNGFPVAYYDMTVELNRAVLEPRNEYRQQLESAGMTTEQQCALEETGAINGALGADKLAPSFQELLGKEMP